MERCSCTIYCGDDPDVSNGLVTPCVDYNKHGRQEMESDDKERVIGGPLQQLWSKGMHQLSIDSGNNYLDELMEIAQDDANGLIKAQESYGNSWKQRGGVGAFMMLARKWDRLENRVKQIQTYAKSTDLDSVAAPFDIFDHIAADQRAEGIIDDIRDLRRYLLLVEAEMVARGFGATHRDNQE